MLAEAVALLGIFVVGGILIARAAGAAAGAALWMLVAMGSGWV